VKILLQIGLILSLSILTGCATIGVTTYAITKAAEKGRQVEQEIIQIYPYSEDRVIWITYILCQDKYGIESYTRAEGVIKTNWITDKYPHDDAPPDFANRMRNYGSPPFPHEKRWSGMRYKYTIISMGLPDGQTQLKVIVALEVYNDFYRSWRWWNSNGTLERLFLTEIEKRLQEAYGAPP
jgi:hypothetical protein